MMKSSIAWFLKKNVIAVMVVIVSFVATIASFVELVNLFRPTKPSSISDTVVDQAQEIKNLKGRVESLNQKLERLDSNIVTFSQTPPESKAGIELKRINNSPNELQTKVSSIEQIVLDNPSKALGIPLLRRDLDNLKESQNSNYISMRQEIERIYDLNKWFIGLMFTIAISILGLAISNIFKGKEKELK